MSEGATTPPTQALEVNSNRTSTNGEHVVPQQDHTEDRPPQSPPLDSIHPATTPPTPTSTGLNYPPADKPIDRLSMSERMMKIGRSCPCDGSATLTSAGSPDEGQSCDCQGWKPKAAGTMGRVDTCACGHKLSHHGGPWSGEEFERRLKASVRRDELLQDKGKLYDFDYEDEDITSLKKQIVPRSTHDEDSESPLVKIDQESHNTNGSLTENGTYGGSMDGAEKRSRPSSPMGYNGLGLNIKTERMDNETVESSERDAKRFKGETDDSTETNKFANGDSDPAEGSTEDMDGEQALAEVQDDVDEVPVKKEKPAVIEEREGLIEFRVITNDGSRESMILLTGMKNIFQKQLPKMPREYIARLVYDRNHYSMAIVKAPLIVLGGITYRPFNHRKFAEIVFCAITSTEQVKGYGSHLMNHLKDYISEHTDVQHFLTYADNYAIGYFKKQGFTKDITLDKSIWMGYIKDYEGGTIMQCTTVPRVKYLSVNQLLQTQRRAVITKIKEKTKSHIIYPGLQDFKNGATEVDPMTVPGIKESGWDPLMDITPRVPVHGPFYNAMKHIVAELIKDASSWPFLHPVDIEAVTDYYSYIKDPMDLSTLESNVDADVYETLDDFAVDCRKIFDNCRVYNGESTPYVKCANKLEKVFKDKLKEWKES